MRAGSWNPPRSTWTGRQRALGNRGGALGAELHRMHQAVDETGFGNFADSPGSERTYSSWSGYLEDFLALHAHFVRQLGISEDRMQATLAFIRTCPFVA